MRSLPALLLVVACTDPEPNPAPSPDSSPLDDRPADLAPNLLLVVLDDVGTDAVATWGEHPDAPPTPTLDALAAEGVLFRNAWAAPACAPSRATILTGRMPRRSGVGGPTHPWKPDTWGLPLEEVTIAEALKAAPVPYATAAVGKWHLTSPDLGGPEHPQKQGFDHFWGSLGNLTDGHASDGRPQGYFDWEKTSDGTLSRVHRWAPSEAVDDAIAFVLDAPEPWFLYVAFQSAHEPFEPPPPQLQPEPLGRRASAVERFRAIVTATDVELARLLSHVDLEHTVVVVLGDNGTPGSVTTPPFDPRRAKQTIAEGGVGVPLVVAGPGIARGAETAVLAHTTDLFPTLAEFAGVAPETLPELDGTSLVPWLRAPDTPPAREVVYTEWFAPNGVGTPVLAWEGAVRDAGFKLVRSTLTGESFFDLRDRHLEGDDLLADGEPADPEAAAALDRLRATLDDWDARLGGPVQRAE